MLTVGIAGYDGGKMAQLGWLDHLFVVPNDIPRIQEAPGDYLLLDASRGRSMTAVGTGNGGMRFVDEYRSGDLAKSLAEQIARLVEPDRHYKFMEVCGGHTLHLQARRRGPAARRDRAGPRAGLPGLRDPDGPPGR